MFYSFPPFTKRRLFSIVEGLILEVLHLLSIVLSEICELQCERLSLVEKILEFHLNPSNKGLIYVVCSELYSGLPLIKFFHLNILNKFTLMVSLRLFRKFGEYVMNMIFTTCCHQLENSNLVRNRV